MSIPAQLAVVVAARRRLELQRGVPDIEMVTDAGIELGEDLFGATATERLTVDLHVSGQRRQP